LDHFGFDYEFKSATDLYKDGTYEIADLDMMRKFDPKLIVKIEKFDPKTIITALYFDGNKGWSVAKRFQVETTTNNQKFPFITEHKSSKLFFATTSDTPKVTYSTKVKSKKTGWELELADFIEVKGWKAIGNKVSDQKLMTVKEVKPAVSEKDKLKAGDSIEFDVDNKNQGNLFE